jgi:hypothetical protein
MTPTIEQEATAIFAAELAAFLDEAIARLDALGGGPTTVGEEKPAKKPRKKVALDSPGTEEAIA